MIDLLMSRRSIRKYKNKNIQEEKINKIIQGALTSPSGKNKKPWDLIMVDSEEILKKLAVSRGPASYFLGDAPLAIVVVANPNMSDTWVEDASIISTIIQLTAHSLDLGSCWVQIRNRTREDGSSVEDYVRELLEIPHNLKILSIMALGYPDENKSPHDKDSLSQNKIHINKY